MNHKLLRGPLVYLVILLHVAFVAGCVSTSAKKISPSDVATANVNLATEYFRLGRMETALKSAKKAVDADAKSVSANSLLALIYQRLEQPLLADEYFLNAISRVQEDTGEFGIIHNNYGVFLCQNNKFTGAEEHFLLAANNKLYSTPQGAYENVGICALKSKKIKLAEKYFRKSLEISPDMPRSLIELANIQYDAEKFLSSRAYLQRYHAMAKSDAKTLFFAIKIEKKLGSFDEAFRIQDELRKRFPDSEEARNVSN